MCRSRGSVGEKRENGEGNAGEYFVQAGTRRRVGGDKTHASGEVARYRHRTDEE